MADDSQTSDADVTYTELLPEGDEKLPAHKSLRVKLKRARQAKVQADRNCAALAAERDRLRVAIERVISLEDRDGFGSAAAFLRGVLD